VSDESRDSGGKGETVLKVLRSRIADGTYRPGSNLPAQRALADEFDVSRDTVQRILRELKSEGWIESRQGSGSKVVTPPIHLGPQPKAPPGRAALGPFIARAFAQPVVELDVFTLTSESLDMHIRLQAERIRAEEIRPPERVSVRMLLPSETAELPYPRARRPVRGGLDADQLDRLLQDRLKEITRRYTTSLRSALLNFKAEGLVKKSATVEVRKVPLVPAFKLYLLRGTEGLFGPYQVVGRTILIDDETEVNAWDVLGLGSTLIRHVNDVGDPGSTGSVFMESWQAWFDSWWERLEPDASDG